MHEEINLGQLVLAVAHDRPGACWRPYVAGRQQGASAIRANRVHDGFGAVEVSAVVDGDPGTLGGEQSGGGAPTPRVAPLMSTTRRFRPVSIIVANLLEHVALGCRPLHRRAKIDHTVPRPSGSAFAPALTPRPIPCVSVGLHGRSAHTDRIGVTRAVQPPRPNDITVTVERGKNRTAPPATQSGSDTSAVERCWFPDIGAMPPAALCPEWYSSCYPQPTTATR